LARQRDYPIKSGNDRKRRIPEDNDRGRRKSGNGRKRRKVESLSFHPVMLRLDRGIGKLAATAEGLPDQVG